MMSDQGFNIIISLTSGFLIGFVLSVALCFSNIGVVKTTYLIEPVLEITVKEGKADTTFIYRKGE